MGTSSLKSRALVALVCAIAFACAAKAPAPKPAPIVVAPPPPPPPMTPRESAAHALTLFNEKKWDEAVPALEAALVSDSPVAPFLRLRLATAEEERGNAHEAAAVLSEIIALGDTSATTVARLRLPAVFAKLGDAGSTDAAFAQALAVPIDELTESEFVTLADQLASAGRADLSTRLRMHLLNDYTAGRYTEKLYGQLSATIDALSLDESVSLASKLAKADRYDQALDLLERVARRFPNAQTQDLYRNVRVRALFNSRNYTKLREETANVALDPALALLRARAAWRSSAPAEFLAGLDAIEKNFPNSPQATEAKIQRAKYYVTDEIDYAKSIDNLQQAIAAGALGSDGENLWNLGWTYLLAGRDDEALRTFDDYVKRFPDGDWKTNSLFWSAKLLDKRGDTAARDAKAAQIASEYPFSYYTYRVKELWPSAAAMATASTRAFPNVESELAAVTDPRIAVVRELLAIDLKRDATREMKAIAASYPDNNGVAFLLADVYVQGGEPFKANGILQRRFREYVRHGGTGIPKRFWEILFPLAYWDTIKEEAAKRNVDPYLLASIIRQESGFEPTTVSNAGAVGLMQIMPEEAARIGSLAGIEGVTRETLFDPRQNIAVGAAEYSQKLATMGGNQVLAIAAYNAGETAVQRWTESTPVDDIDRFVEAIPYAETRLYVKSVTRNRYEYQRIYR